MLLHEVHSGRLFHLNGTAARIWPWLRATTESEALVDRLVALHEVDPARARADGNAGLGLAITKEIVEAHGGEVGVSSSEEEGTEFVITLPVHGAPE